jgi:hypothetical protein
VFVGTVYGTIKSGGLVLANTTPATAANTGALQIWGGASVTGNIVAGNIYTDGFRFANGTPLTNLTLSNVATYLTTYTGNLSAGNISAGNVTANHYGSVHADLISPLVTSVTVFNTTTAIGLPVGSVAARPTGVQGYLRYNSDAGVNTVEYYDGSNWIPFKNAISDQQITPDGVNSAFTLNQAATAEGLLVSINGTVQRPGSAPNGAYTVSGTTITFNEVPNQLDIIDIRYIASASTATLTGLSGDITTSGNISANSLTLTSAIQFANLTTAQVNTIPSPARGMTVYNYTTGNIQVYNGTKWANVVLS